MNLRNFKFSGLNPIDKIVYSSGIITITNTGPTSPSERNNISALTLTNPVSKRVYLKYKWSLDGNIWQTGQSHVWYPFNRIVIGTGTFAATGLKAAVSMGVNSTNVYIRTASSYHGDITYNPSPSFTPITQTFYIKYWLYEL